MKIVRLSGGAVTEIIPEYALPVENWYGKEFANQCIEAPDDVEHGMVYNQETGTFSTPTPEPAAPTVEEQLASLTKQLATTQEALDALALA